MLSFHTKGRNVHLSLNRPLTAFALVALVLAQPTDERATLGDRVMTLTRESSWTFVSSVPVKFQTFHPQGMVRVGDALFVSSVEVSVRTKRFAEPVGGYDRDTGEGVGHLFKMDLQGNLVAALRIGEGSVYHPGGIDYDGASIWVPVAEYRPNSRSIVYRVDPVTMKAVEVFRVADHIGALVHDTTSRTLHGVSWGSRRFYRWFIDAAGRVSASTASEKSPTLNPSHYVDYQDCKYAGRNRMVCTGVTEIRQPGDTRPFRLGGLDLISLRDNRPLHQVPVLLWTSTGLDMTHNPVWLEPSSSGLRAYFMPDDDRSTLYVYEVR
jgi:hypothetical protein